MRHTEPTSDLAKQLQVSLEHAKQQQVVDAQCPRCLRAFKATYVPGLLKEPSGGLYTVWCNSCRRIYAELLPRLRSRPGQLFLPGLLDSEELPAASVSSARRRKRG